MIVMASSNPGDIVLDCFAGSGTTLGAAYMCERCWIGADNGIESLKAILKRFTDGLDIYGDYVKDSVYEQCTLELEMERQEKSGEGKCHQQVSIGNIHQLNWMNLMPPEKFIGVRQEIQDEKFFAIHQREYLYRIFG